MGEPSGLVFEVLGFVRAGLGGCGWRRPACRWVRLACCWRGSPGLPLGSFGLLLAWHRPACRWVCLALRSRWLAFHGRFHRGCVLDSVRLGIVRRRFAWLRRGVGVARLAVGFVWLRVRVFAFHGLPLGRWLLRGVGIAFRVGFVGSSRRWRRRACRWVRLACCWRGSPGLALGSFGFASRCITLHRRAIGVGFRRCLDRSRWVWPEGVELGFRRRRGLWVLVRLGRLRGSGRTWLGRGFGQRFPGGFVAAGVVEEGFVPARVRSVGIRGARRLAGAAGEGVPALRGPFVEGLGWEGDGAVPPGVAFGAREIRSAGFGRIRCGVPWRHRGRRGGGRRPVRGGRRDAVGRIARRGGRVGGVLGRRIAIRRRGLARILPALPFRGGLEPFAAARSRLAFANALLSLSSLAWSAGLSGGGVAGSAASGPLSTLVVSTFSEAGGFLPSLDGPAPSAGASSFLV